MPRYAFLLVALIGDEANRPEVCHGIRQFPTPCSIALTIWDVTFAYTSGLSGAGFSFVDVAAPLKLLVFRDRAGLASVAVPLSFWCAIRLHNRTSELTQQYT